MSVLDTFIFLLEANSSNAVRGLDRAGRAFDDLRERGERGTDDLGEDVEDLGERVNHQANRIKSALAQAFSGIRDRAGDNFGLASSLTAIAGAAGGAILAGVSFNAILERQESILQRVNDAANFNIDISQYDALSKVFQENGLDADGFRDSIFDLNEALGEAASDAGSGKAESFKKFGIGLKDAQGNIKGADVALVELAGSMEKLSRQEAIFQIKQLGITDNATIDTLLKGKKYMEDQIALQKQKGVLDKNDAENALKYKAAMNELSSTISSLLDILGAALLPVLTDVSKGFLAFVNFVRDHKGFVVGAFGAIAGIGVVKLIPMIKNLTLAMQALKIETLLALWPFALIGAAIVGVGLLVDDLWTYINGGDSVIGDLIKKFPVLGEAIEAVKSVISSIGEAFANPEKAFEKFKKSFGDAWTQMSNEAKQIFTELWNFVVDLFNNLGEKIKNVAGSAWDSVKSAANPMNWFSDNDDNPSNQAAVPAMAANTAITGAAGAPVIGRGNSSAVSNTQTIQVDKVEVHTQATDGQGVANSFADGLKQAYAGTTQQYSTGRSH